MKLSNISLASLSLDSSTCTDIICGSNGLPLTPHSIRIIGDFKALVENVEHPNLTKYVECFRNKNERITLVFENPSTQAPDKIDFLKTAKQLLDALYHMHEVLNLVHGLISPACIVWSNDDIKLAHWPINYLTSGGEALGTASILPNDTSFISPEQVEHPGSRATQQSDIWSIGMLLLKLMKPNSKLMDKPSRLAYCDSSSKVIEQLGGSYDDTISDDELMWNNFFAHALEPNPRMRSNLHELYSILHLNPLVQLKEPLYIPLIPNRYELEQESICNLNISEIYYLWRLSIGRNFESEQKYDDCPPILKIPYLIVSEKISNQQVTEEFKKPEHYTVINLSPKSISLTAFTNDLDRIDKRIFHPLLLTNNDSMLNEKTFTMPIVIKEADFAYQCERVILFKRLISGCPYLKEHLKREASIDIPPFYRAQTWTLLLDVSVEHSRKLYKNIDKTTPLATDRQISVDIPRCHQYNELMASPQGHQKLARILKAWLNHNTPEYVYWQGLDSLAAPFLLLNFDDEAMAFACFNAFVDKYLKGFFRKDNQLIVQQYLSMFSELISYHDAPLASHLEKLGFLPNLYAIPWFLTMFTHVLPLHKILHVWDCLLLGDEKFPLCIGLAILNQLKQELMNYSFNDCIVAFSDLPEIDIERCIRDASNFYNSTPENLINLNTIEY